MKHPTLFTYLGSAVLFGVIALLAVNNAITNKDTGLTSAQVTPIEVTYKATSPVGKSGGTILPASCESNAWNANGGYHSDGVQTDPGNCNAVVPVITASCGTASGVKTNSSPSTNLCAVGTPSSVSGTGSGPWSWVCSVSATDKKDCTAPQGDIAIDPPKNLCDPRTNGKEFPVRPESNLCSKGFAGAITGTGSKTDPWKWTCKYDGAVATVSGEAIAEKAQVNKVSQLAQVSGGIASGRGGDQGCGDQVRNSGVECRTDAIAGEDEGGGILDTFISIIINPIIEIITPITETITPRPTEPIIVNPVEPVVATPIVVETQECSATRLNEIDDLPAVPVIGGTTVIDINSPTANTIIATDPEGDELYYQIDWNDGSPIGTTDSSQSGVVSNIGHKFTKTGRYVIRGRAVEVNDKKQKSAWATYTIRVVDSLEIDDIPTTPVIGGTIEIGINNPTANTIVATDPEGDELYYEIDWNGNGTVDGDTSIDPGPRPSGEFINIGHTYRATGTYTIKGRAVEINGKKQKSTWATYTIRVVNSTCTEINACELVHTRDAGGNCVAQPLPPRYSDTCTSAANACGQTNTGTVTCSGACNAVAPSDAGCTGSCNSAANNCGDTNIGTIVGGICNASKPADRVCTGGPGGTTINSFRASPKLVAAGKSAKLFWDVTGNPSSCSISYTTNTNGNAVSVIGNVSSAQGSIDTGPVTEKRFYLLKCGVNEARAEVSVFSLTEI